MKPLVDRYYQKIQKDDETGCWEWQAVKNNKGYGMLSISAAVGKWLAHRISYELHIGPIPHGARVLHRCDNPGCSNPKHLFLGSMKDNYDDMVAKGRRVIVVNPNNRPPAHSADDHPMAKLTSEIVRELRIQHANGKSLCSLARAYGVNKAAMRRALQGKTWPNAGGPLAKPQINKYETYVGSVHANSKLTEDIVRQARSEHALGVSGQKLADRYGVSLSVMYDALKGRSWKHVT